MTAAAPIAQARPNRKQLAKLLERAIASHQAGDLATARAHYETILAVQPRQIESLANLGAVYVQSGDPAGGLELIERALRENPNQPYAVNSRGNALRALGRLEEAEQAYRRALAQSPGYADAHYNLGGVLQNCGRLEAAIASYQAALAIEPDYIDALNNCGIALRDLGRVDAAIEAYDRALVIDAGRADTHNNRGVALQSSGELDAALASYERAVTLAPLFAAAWSNRSHALFELERYPEALLSCDEALALSPDYSDALSNRGIILRPLGRGAESLAAFERAIELNPRHAEALTNRGAMLQELFRWDEAYACHDRALAIAPNFPEALQNRGVALLIQRRWEESLRDIERAVQLRPRLRHALGTLVFLKLALCEWGGLAELSTELLAILDRHPDVAIPFELMATPASLAQLRRSAERWVGLKYPPQPGVGRSAASATGRRLKIGYVSSDFRNHAVTHLVLELLERHDRSRFEVIGIACGPAHDDPYKDRVVKACDQFIEVGAEYDKAVMARVAVLELDIAVDLNGHTENAGTALFARRLAPLQVGYLGYPGTSGASYFDYLVSDEIVIPAAHRPHYSEQIAYLPGCFQVNSQRPDPERRYTRAELGLPAEGVVFCSFNNTYKITPDIYDVWMRLLHQVPGSVLWLRDIQPRATANLVAEAERRGIDKSRLVFAQPVGYHDHHARLRVADLFLDSLYYNAHTTAGDALWAGVPVITRIGETFASRVAASLLAAAELPGLVATSTEMYEALALELARRPEVLAGLKRRLAETRTRLPLFDVSRTIGNLERAYELMWQRAVAGLPPEHLSVPAAP